MFWGQLLLGLTPVPSESEIQAAMGTLVLGPRVFSGLFFVERHVALAR